MVTMVSDSSWIDPDGQAPSRSARRSLGSFPPRSYNSGNLSELKYLEMPAGEANCKILQLKGPLKIPEDNFVPGRNEIIKLKFDAHAHTMTRLI